MMRDRGIEKEGQKYRERQTYDIKQTDRQKD